MIVFPGMAGILPDPSLGDSSIRLSVPKKGHQARCPRIHVGEITFTILRRSYDMFRLTVIPKTDNSHLLQGRLFPWHCSQNGPKCLGKPDPNFTGLRIRESILSWLIGHVYLMFHIPPFQIVLNFGVLKLCVKINSFCPYLSNTVHCGNVQHAPWQWSDVPITRTQ